MFYAKTSIGCKWLISCILTGITCNATSAICASSCTGLEKICTILPSVQQTMLFEFVLKSPA